jgi:hypothetical protein
VEIIRVWIEGFLRGRYGYEGNQVYRALAGLALIGAILVTVWQVAGPLLCVGALALVLLALRVLRGLRLLAVPMLIGAIVLAGWLLIATLKASLLIPPVPRFTSEGPVVRNGVAAVVACGKKRSLGPMIAPEPRTGGWWPDQRGDCTTWYHRPPGLEQRLNRNERAH